MNGIFCYYSSSSFYYYYYYVTAVVIGFVMSDYAARESDGTVKVEVAVMSGRLSSDVVVRFDTQDGRATGVYSLNHNVTVCVTLKRAKVAYALIHTCTYLLGFECYPTLES